MKIIFNSTLCREVLLSNDLNEPLVIDGKDSANFILNTLNNQNKGLLIYQVTSIPKDKFNINAFMDLDIGSLVNVEESVSAPEKNTPYFINGYEFEIINKKYVGNIFASFFK